MDLYQISRDAAFNIVAYNNHQIQGGKALSNDQLESLLTLATNWVELVINELWNIYELSLINQPSNYSEFKAWLRDPQSLGMWASRRNLSNGHLIAFDGSFGVSACQHLIELRLVRQNLMSKSLQLISEQL